ncbi:MAG: tetratricopeptide repeat protein, partial [Longimicrobiales bacterium]
MKAVAKLKDEARKFEQSEQWESAIQAYIEVLRITDNAESELPLYNRVGDLYVRMGRPLDAVTYYEQAADHYAEAGLYNNAIALCNKALRYVPNRLELLRKLGQFSAAQGFLLDARRWYLEYAERQLKNGALDDAFTALEDFATVYDDAEIRELLGRQLLAHNRLGPAVIALKRAHALRLDAGEQAAADALKAEIQKLAPDAFLGDKVEPRAARVAPPPPAAPLPPAPRRSNDLPGFSDFDFEAGAGPGYAPPPPAMPTPPPAPVEPEIEQSFLGEAEDAELGFDEQLANLALDRALDPGVEAPVENSHAAEPPAQRIEAPIASTPQDTVDPGKDDQDFPEDADDLPLMDDLLPEPGVGFTLDLPPLVEAFDLDQSQPLPFLSFGETGSTMGQDETDDPLPRLDFDKIVPGLRPTLTDLPEFETTEPLQPIDLDAAFASMSSPPPPLPATPPTPVPAEPDSWTEVPEWESSAEIEYGSDPTVPGERAEETIDAQDWVRPTDLEFTQPPLEPLTSRPAPAPIEPPAPAAPFVEPISTTPPIPEPLVASPGTKFDRAPAMAPQPTEEDLDPLVREPF